MCEEEKEYEENRIGRKCSQEPGLNCEVGSKSPLELCVEKKAKEMEKFFNSAHGKLFLK